MRLDVLPGAVAKAEKTAAADSEEHARTALGVGGEQQTPEVRGVLLGLDAELGGAGPQFAEAAVGEPVQTRLEIAPASGPDVRGQAGVAAADGAAYPATGLGGGEVGPFGDAGAAGHGDHDKRRLAAAEARGEQGVAARLAAVARGVPADGGGAQGVRAVVGSVEHGVGDEVVQLVRLGRGQRGGLGVIGGRSATDVCDVGARLHEAGVGWWRGRIHGGLRRCGRGRRRGDLRRRGCCPRCRGGGDRSRCGRVVVLVLGGRSSGRGLVPGRLRAGRGMPCAASGRVAE